MRDFVTHSNIERFEKLLETEADEGKALILRGLLATEKAKDVVASRREAAPIRAIMSPPRR